MSQAWHDLSALALGAGIKAGEIDPVELAAHFLERAEAADADRKIYLRTTPERARAEAEAARERARLGLSLGPLDGVPISWKDLFNTAGVVTSHGSVLLADRVPDSDAEVVARATRAGLVCLGKTNQTEFAFSGLGVNPGYGTPANPFDETCARIPGGSSSGAAVSVARGLAAGAIGTDTGGSVRIPSAWCGLVGLKTTYGLLPLDGVLPLSPSLDSVGPLARDVADANAILGALAARPAADLEGASLKGTRLAVARSVVWDRVEPGVEAAIQGAIERLGRAGAEIIEEAAPELAEADEILNRYGSSISAEAYAIWGELVEGRPNLILNAILERMRLGQTMTAADSERSRIGLREVAKRLHARMAQWDAVIAPTVTASPPPLADIEADEQAYHRANGMALRNTRLGNFLDLCALTLPCGDDGTGLPVGLMLMAPPFEENRLLRLAAAAEAAIGARGQSD